MEKLYILPFDHYNAFVKFLADPKVTLTDEVKNKVSFLKLIVYKSILRAIDLGIPVTDTTVLVDELFASEIILDAKKRNISVCLGTEKHNTSEFDFAYGVEWMKHIEKFQPTIVKALVNYNPANDGDLNKRQNKKLKQLSDYCIVEGYQFLLEPLAPPTKEQLKTVNNDISRYDEELRLELFLKSLGEFYQAGVEPNIWKIEGYKKIEQFEAVLDKVKSLSSDEVKIIMLGRAMPLADIKVQLQAAAKAGLFGFAVGRTIFEQPLKEYLSGLSEDKTIDAIANNFYNLYKIFIKAKDKDI